ncbi:GNAT family N-acetyltransferase [Patulibacter sp. SYSU D01012]|uniref:GNAT family N-acetyltransferase n=1 Tax=Patulibacter sp. SYSU D01012 TaxID=2817381 RepID=UPI001B30AD0D|nr:GNAT family N-acetyltransferase [Patulibacter sp. SYSU D01012]
MQHRAFGEEPDDEEIARGAAALTTPAVAARGDGEVVVGAGGCLPAHDGVTELVGIAVAAPHRRRGIAAAVTADLLARAFAAGVTTAMLTPGDEATGRVYARAGFADVGEMLHLRA